jgi:hypothetical protein
MQKAMYDLRTLWKREKNPAHIYSELKKLGNSYRERYPNVPGALIYLERTMQAEDVDQIGFGELMKRLLE